MSTTLGSSFYSPDDHSHILLSPRFHKAAEEQSQNNEEAMYAGVRDALRQPPGSPRRNERIVAIFYETLPISTNRLCHASGLDESKLAEIRYKEPISIHSCLQCREHLSEVDRRTHVCRGRTLRYLSKCEAGSFVRLDRVCELLCTSCSQEVYDSLKEEHRKVQLAHQARRKELCRLARDNYPAYLQTPELKAIKNRVRIRAGNRCQVCGTTDKPLEVHHNDYSRLGGDELLEDFVLLCKDCHQKYHGIQSDAA